MKYEYKVDNEYLTSKGLDLNEYALDGTFVPIIIERALDIAVSRCCTLNDNFLGETDVEKALDENPNLLSAFYKLQFNVAYNLIFANEDNPVDSFIDNIIVHELGWGKINGYQKGLYYKNN